MKNQIVSTTYAALRPPYQVIKYNQDVAMQIGTLIVTIQKDESEYQIETHSHPVVAYEYKERDGIANVPLIDHQLLEGAVWNKVEVKEVTTVCLTGAILTWDEFQTVLEEESFRQMYRKEPDIQLYWHLQKFGVKVLPPEEHVCTIPIALHIQPEEVGLSLQANIENSLFLNVSVAEDDFQTGKDNVFYIPEEERWDSHEWKDPEKVYQELAYQLSSYSLVFRHLLFQKEYASFNVEFTTDVERYKDVVKRINENESLTRLGF